MPDVASAPQTALGYTTPTGYLQATQAALEEEPTPELQWPRNIDVYDAMRSQDSQTGSVLRAVTLPIRRTPWRIDQAGASDEVARFVAVDLGLPILGEGRTDPPQRTRDRFSFADHLREALLMLPFGHMFFEQEYRVTSDGGVLRAHLRKLSPRMPRTLEEISVADDGGLQWIRQRSTGSGPSPEIPVARLVAYVHEKEGGNWRGRSVLRTCYKNWLLKDQALRTGAQTIDRNGLGVPLYTGPEAPAPDDLTKGLAMAKAWRSGQNAGSAVPYGAKMELLGVTGTLPDALPFIRYQDEQIARAVLAHFLNLGTQTGSWALGTTFADFFVMSLQTLGDQLADVVNQHVIEDLVDVNWGPEEPAPRVVFQEIGSRREATADAIKVLVESGVIRTDRDLEEFVRDIYQLPAKGTPVPGQPPPAPVDPNAPPMPPPVPNGAAT